MNQPGLAALSEQLTDLSSVRMPNLSSSMSVGRLRYIQSIHESSERRNPDTLVKRFIPLVERWRLRWMRREDVSRLRADSFYYYLVARTKYYDQVFAQAGLSGIRCIVNIGCGTDTRAHRFEALLHSNDVVVLECDQAEAIEVKARVAGRWRSSNRIEYLPIDLNDRSWSNLALWLPAHAAGPLLVMLEGVSPYIDDDAFTRFLEFLGASLTPDSIVAYDFKFRGANDAWGRSDATRTPFRLSTVRADVESFHETRGFQIESFESSGDLSQRVLNGSPLASVFAEDGLIRLRVARHT